MWCSFKRRTSTTWQQLIFAVVIFLCLSAWLLLEADPARAQDKTVNYTLSELQGQDFSHKDLEGTSFAGANMQGANFQGANLRGTILTKGSFFKADLSSTLSIKQHSKASQTKC